MSMGYRSCHGQFDSLEAGSTHQCMHSMFKIYQMARSYATWYLENVGLWGVFKHIVLKVVNVHVGQKNKLKHLQERKTLPPDQEVLNLRPGELVEVKCVKEILATLDESRKYNGLLWMTGMRKHCGKRYRVFKRVETILLESNGELRKMKNTVLLQGVMCDGAEFCGCDRSCFHFWREAWLRRVKEDG